jgi:VanZ family protein
VIRWPGSGALKPFVRPQRWLGAWWGMVLAVIVGSMLPALLLPEVPQGGDKVEHVLGYFTLAAVAVQLFAGRAAVLRAGGGLVAMGVLIEIAQGTLTTSRAMDPWDALANTLGVLAGLATAWLPMRDALLKLER